MFSIASALCLIYSATPCRMSCPCFLFLSDPVSWLVNDEVESPCRGIKLLENIQSCKRQTHAGQVQSIESMHSWDTYCVLGPA